MAGDCQSCFFIRTLSSAESLTGRNCFRGRAPRPWCTKSTHNTAALRFSNDHDNPSQRPNKTHRPKLSSQVTYLLPAGWPRLARPQSSHSLKHIFPGSHTKRQSRVQDIYNLILSQVGKLSPRGFSKRRTILSDSQSPNCTQGSFH